PTPNTAAPNPVGGTAAANQAGQTAATPTNQVGLYALTPGQGPAHLFDPLINYFQNRAVAKTAIANMFPDASAGQRKALVNKLGAERVAKLFGSGGAIVPALSEKGEVAFTPPDANAVEARTLVKVAYKMAKLFPQAAHALLAAASAAPYDAEGQRALSVAR